MKKYAIILAAGLGSRMKSNLPKCMMNFCGKTMIEHIVDSCVKCHFDEIIVVVGYKKEYIYNLLKEKVKFIVQEKQLGTAHAVLCCENFFINKNGVCIIIPGDMPMIDCEVINNLIDKHILSNSDLTFVSTTLEDAKEYGRVYRIENQVKKIIEYKDATESEKLIKEINCGLYCIDCKKLFKELKTINNNNLSKEYYLTDLIEIFNKKYKVSCLNIKESYKLIGINDLQTLEEAKTIYKENINKNLKAEI